MTHPQMTGLFHTGMVVRDLDLAMADLTEAFGFSWAPPARSAGNLHSPAGLAFRESRLTFSLEGPHHIELVEQVDSTAWQHGTGGPMVHHLGFVVDDLPAEVERLNRIGFKSEFVQEASDGGMGGFSYHYNHHGGLWLELVASSVKALTDRWIEDGTLPNPSLE